MNDYTTFGCKHKYRKNCKMCQYHSGELELLAKLSEIDDWLQDYEAYKIEASTFDSELDRLEEQQAFNKKMIKLYSEVFGSEDYYGDNDGEYVEPR